LMGSHPSLSMASSARQRYLLRRNCNDDASAREVLTSNGWLGRTPQSESPYPEMPSATSGTRT
jgi:hypothetical protein